MAMLSPYFGTPEKDEDSCSPTSAFGFTSSSELVSPVSAISLETSSVTDSSVGAFGFTSDSDASCCISPPSFESSASDNTPTIRPNGGLSLQNTKRTLKFGSQGQGTSKKCKDNVWAIMMNNCCQEECFMSLSPNEVRETRKKYQIQSATKTDERNLILNYIKDHTPCRGEEAADRNTTKFLIKGKLVCKKAWLISCGINEKRFNAIRQDFLKGSELYQHGNTGSKKHTAKTAECLAWLNFLVNAIGDQQPDSNKIHLPSCFTKLSLYRKMSKEVNKEVVVSRSQFYNIMEKKLTHVVIPKENRFTKCDSCTHYKKLLETTMEKSKRKEIEDLLQKHIALVMNEREKYHLHRYKAKKDPSKYITVILDGMDQSKTDVPNLRRISKSTANLQKLRTHLVGTIVHSGLCPMGKAHFGVFDLFQFKHDSNLTINIIILVLELVNSRFGLPPVLNLQLDNCWRENKNRYVFSLLSLLVEWSIFDKIKGNFLPVGHTHEDIDALFGLFSKCLRLQDIYTFDDLRESFEECTDKPRPESIRAEKMYDFKEWIIPHSHDIHQHVKPHCFKFVRNEAGKAVMWYRKWSGEPWKGPVTLLKSTPENFPKVLQPDFTKADLPKLINDLPKWFDSMPASAKEWWEAFMDGVDKNITGTQADVDSLLYKLKNELQRPAVEIITQPTPTVNLQYREKEIAVLEEIYTGQYQPPASRGVQQDDNFLDALVCGAFVAVNIANCKKVPVIGKVEEVYDNEFKINYWKGGYGKPWEEHMVKRGRLTIPWTDVLPKESVILCGFQLDNANKLQENSRKFLKHWYCEQRKKYNIPLNDKDDPVHLQAYLQTKNES